MANTNSGQNGMKEDLGELIGQLQLSELQKSSLQSRWLDQVSWMEAKARRMQFRYYTLRIIAIVGGVFVPALVGLSASGSMEQVRWAATFVLGLAVAISVAVEEFFHYGERWRHYRSTVEILKSEGWQLFQLSGPYKEFASHADAYRQFADRVEQIIKADVSQFITEVVQQKKEVAQVTSEATEWREKLLLSQLKGANANAVSNAVAETGPGIQADTSVGTIATTGAGSPAETSSSTAVGTGDPTQADTSAGPTGDSPGEDAQAAGVS